MKLFKVSYDATIITLMAEDEKDAFALLKEKDDNFFEDKEDGYCYRWDKDNYEDISISQVQQKRGVIRWESH
jgi:hypothetical protein